MQSKRRIGMSPVVESLENRRHLSADLVSQFSGAVPTTLLAAQKTKTDLDLGIANTGASAYKSAGGAAKLVIYLSSSQNTNASEIPIAAAPVHGTIGVGQVRNVIVAIKSLSASLAGTYYLDARISQAALPTQDTFSSTQVTIDTPAVDLVPQVYGISHSGKDGMHITPEIQINNTGNSTAKGSLRVEVQFSFYKSGADPLFFRTVNVPIKIAAGGSKLVHLGGNVPKFYRTFEYYMVASINGNRKIVETNYNNNTSIGGLFLLMHP